ncbi:extracellular solute-binding protein [Paenibacillus sp. J2TS4]|uniref:extracellular solute-binding protein n=1 Tax=Paenibacillus sp. J2TS4 TaxID=2807194 RepID=UPI001AFD23EE|nr:extracellular solute-binding protein [Paenibacillus sp. J2TS4]GIP34210.1 ABC transporter substrate-binding protein [Paenibacillus sp. J2TS4]
MKKGMALFAVTGMIVLAIACSNKERLSQEPVADNPKVNMSGMPIVDEPIKLQIFAGKSPTTANNWNDVMLWNEYKKMTNIEVEWIQVPFDSLSERRNIVLAGGDYPDAFHTALFSNADIVRYGTEGIFIRLNDLIDQYAPNLKAILDQYPELRKALTMPDGNIYSFPTFVDPEFQSSLAGSKMWINKKWLDAAGIEEPQTTDDFYNMLKAFKDGDFNQNGLPDEIPYGGVKVSGLINYLKGAWGLGNRGNSHPYVDIDPDTKELRFIPISLQYKEVLEFVHKLYKEELIQKDIFSVNSSAFYAKGSEGLYGSLITTSPVTLMNQQDYIGASALKGPAGDQLYAFVTSPSTRLGSFVITDKNEHPEATVRWIDHFYGEEGRRMFFFGFENVTYTAMDDGTYTYTKEITDNPKGLTFEQALAQYLTWPGGGYPGFITAKYFQGAEGRPEALEATEKLAPYFPEEIWSSFNYTLDEYDQLASLGADLGSYVEEMQSKFVSGQASFAEWDEYVSTLNKIGLEKYMKIYKDAFDRYQQN